MGGRPLPVLLVDDDPASRLLLCLALDEVGIPWLEAGDVRCAKEILATTAVQAVLLDQRLADGSRHDVLLALRADPRTRGLPVLMVTADADPASVARGLDAGADDFVVKPIEPEVLLARLRAQQRSTQRVALGLQRQWQRRAQLAALVSQPAGPDPYRTAGVDLCREIVAAGDADGAVLLRARGYVMEVAARWGITPADWHCGQRIPNCYASELSPPAARDPVVWQTTWRLGGGRRALASAAPIRASGEPVGILVLLSAPDHPAPSRGQAALLAAAVDYALIFSTVLDLPAEGDLSRAGYQRMERLIASQAF
jgi:CheY-like chemotaxis protein